jgi:tRNA(Ile)-lysidine synthase
MFLTAHHADDNIETFLINLGRGTGLMAVGIPSQNDKIIRPLLLFSRRNRKLRSRNTIAMRGHSSNASNKYLRNKIDISSFIERTQFKFCITFQKTHKSTLRSTSNG